MDFENIKNLLGEAYTEDVENAIKALVDGSANGGAGYVPQAKYNKIKEQYDELVSKQSSFQEVETEKRDLEKKLNDLQTAYTTLEEESKAKLTELKNEHLFERKLAGFKPKNLKALSALINKDKLTYNEYDIEGLKEQIEELQKSDSFLFEESPVGTGVPCEATALKKAMSSAEDKQLRQYFGLEENEKSKKEN